jgi:hypothetical protein
MRFLRFDHQQTSSELVWYQGKEQSMSSNDRDLFPFQRQRYSFLCIQQTTKFRRIESAGISARA